MATTITYESDTDPRNAGGQTSKVSGTISQADMSFMNVSNPLAPTATTVTADKVRTHLINPADAVTAGIPPGQYEKSSGVVYRLVR